MINFGDKHPNLQFHSVFSIVSYNLKCESANRQFQQGKGSRKGPSLDIVNNTRNFVDSSNSEATNMGGDAVTDIHTS